MANVNSTVQDLINAINVALTPPALRRLWLAASLNHRPFEPGNLAVTTNDTVLGAAASGALHQLRHPQHHRHFHPRHEPARGQYTGLFDQRLSSQRAFTSFTVGSKVFTYTAPTGANTVGT